MLYSILLHYSFAFGCFFGIAAFVFLWRVVDARSSRDRRGLVVAAFVAFACGLVAIVLIRIGSTPNIVQLWNLQCQAAINEWDCVGVAYADACVKRIPPPHNLKLEPYQP
jgi:hypothetical protein